MPVKQAAEKRPGQNEPTVDFAALESSRLRKDYEWLEASVRDALEKARELPAEVTDDDVQSDYASAVKSLRDLHARIEALRVTEKEPHYRRGVATDSFFNTFKAKIAKDKKHDPNGAIDVLQARIDNYVRAKAEAARRAREEEERIAREAERKAREEREKAERAAREAEQKAARARNEEKRREAEAAAEAARLEADRRAREEERARQERQDASASAQTKTADMVRTRTESGHMVTARREPYVEITDSMALDPAKLWAFVKDDHKLAALKAWAKTTGYKQQMAGAVIEMRDRAVVS